MRRIALLAAGLTMLAGCITAWAQEVTAEEMIQLDKLRAQFEAQGIKVTPEQEIRMLQRIRALKAAANPAAQGSAGAALQVQIPQRAGGLLTAAAPVAKPVVGATMSEGDLKKRLDALPPGKALANVEYLRDGFQHDGLRFADPEGRVEQFTVDAMTGAVGYLVKGSLADGQPVKLARLGSDAGSSTASLTIGRVRRQGSQYQFESITGQALAGELLYVLTDGVLVMRDSVGFRYVAGEGVRQINFPTGWYPTPLQRGNVAATGWLLLEKDSAEEKKSPLSLFSDLGRAVGLSEANEYALMNTSDGRLVVLDVSTSGKSVTSFSQCRRKNRAVNVCDQSTTYDSTWDANGGRNFLHYFWRMDWQRTAGGSVLVALEKGVKQVNAYDLASGKKVNLFERGMGIGALNTSMMTDGRLRVIAAVGFENGQVDDVASELKSRPDVRTEAGAEAGKIHEEVSAAK
jgi:hypothetical protein